MSRKERTIIAAVFAVIALAGIVGLGAWLAYVAPSRTFSVNGFTFSGPSSLQDPPLWTFRGPGAVGRKNPYFLVHPLGEIGIDLLLRDEATEIRRPIRRNIGLTSEGGETAWNPDPPGSGEET